MFKSAAAWQKVWPSFEAQSLDHIERALAALSKQLGIETREHGEKGQTGDQEGGEGMLYSQHVAQFLDRVLEEARKNDET